MLFTHATIITVNPSREILLDGAILVHGNLIIGIDKTDFLKKAHPDEEIVNLEGHVIIPGLISTHMHTAQTLLRGTLLDILRRAIGFYWWSFADECDIGAADDLELVTWLCERIWVLQGNFTGEDGYAAARISIAEMLKTGTTCFLESMVSNLPLPLSSQF